MKKANSIPAGDEVVLYHSQEDSCWVAHSLRTDQVGAGDRMVDALAALIRGLRELRKLAEADKTIAYLREAPADVQEMARTANALPLEIYEVAHKMVTGEWPDYLRVDVTAENPGRPLKAKLGKERCPA